MAPTPHLSPSTQRAISPSPHSPPTHPVRKDIHPNRQSPHRIAGNPLHMLHESSQLPGPVSHAGAHQSRSHHARPEHRQWHHLPVSASPAPPYRIARSASPRCPPAGRTPRQPHQYPTLRRKDFQMPSRYRPQHPTPPCTPTYQFSPTPRATPPASGSDSVAKTLATPNKETPA